MPIKAQVDIYNDDVFSAIVNIAEHMGDPAAIILVKTSYILPGTQYFEYIVIDIQCINTIKNGKLVNLNVFNSISFIV
jgi:hypothetical protein